MGGLQCFLSDHSCVVCSAFSQVLNGWSPMPCARSSLCGLLTDLSISDYPGFKTPSSPVRSSPMERSMDRSMEASASPSGLRHIPPPGMDRKQSEPVLGRGQNLSMDDHRLAR